jgi:preprotein translocase subunit Sec63
MERLDSKYTGPCKCEKCMSKHTLLLKKKRTLSWVQIVVILAFLFCWLLALYLVFYSLSPIDAESATQQNFDPWEILDVGDEATAADIKKSYRKLSLKYHPDKNTEPGAEDMFVKINKAYEILTGSLHAVRAVYCVLCTVCNVM